MVASRGVALHYVVSRLFLFVQCVCIFRAMMGSWVVYAGPPNLPAS